MPDKIQSYKVICQGGLNAGDNHLDLSENRPGAATRLVNYEPSLYGGYRRINGYAPLDIVATHVSPGTAEGPVLAVAIFKDDATNSSYVIAARKNIGAATYSFYRLVPLSGWQLMPLPAGVTRAMSGAGRTVIKLRFDQGHFAGTNYICFVDGVNPAIAWDGTTWREIKSTNVGTLASSGGNQAVDRPSLVGIFKNYLLLGGDTYAHATLAYSAPNAPWDFTANGGAGQITAGFDVIQFRPFRDNLFLFGTNAIKKLTPDSTATFLLDNVTTNVGCIAADSVIEIGGDLVFLAPDGLRPVAGTSRIGDVEIETISKSIQLILATLPSDFDLDRLNSVVIRAKSQLRYLISDPATAVTNSYGILGALRTADQGVGWEFSELQGIRASSCTSGFIGREEYVIHGDYDGAVYRQESGTSFNGADIVSVYATPYFDMGDTEVRKGMYKVNTFIRAEGAVELNLSVTYDWDDPATARPTSYSNQNAGFPVRYRDVGVEYGGPNIFYGGSTKPIITTDIQGSCNSVRLTVVSLGQGPCFSIQGFVFEFGIAGRR